MHRFRTLVICLLTIGSGSASAQTPSSATPQLITNENRGGLPVTVITVPVTSTGIGDTTFLNAANPPDLLRVAGNSAAELLFRNDSTEEIVVTLDETRLVIPAGEARPANLASLSAPPGAPVRFEVSAANGRYLGMGFFLMSGAPLVAAPPPPSSPAAAQPQRSQTQSRDPGATVRTLSIPASPVGAVSPTPATTDTQYATRVALNGTGVDDWDFRNSRNPPYLLKILAADAPAIQAFAVQFRARLAASTNPAVLTGVNAVDTAWKEAERIYSEALKTAGPGDRLEPPENPWHKLALLDRSVLEFSNRSIDRIFSITLDIPEPPEFRDAGINPAARAGARRKFESDHQVKLGDCSGAAPVTCKLVITVPFDAPKMVRPWLFIPRESSDPDLAFISWFKYLSASQTPIAFAANFFDENATPAESVGYVSLVPLPALKEPASKTSWVLSPTIAAQRDPLLADGVTLSSEAPFAGDIRRQFSGTGRLQLKQTLGGRADAVVELAFKSGVFGEKDQTGRVSVPTYQVNINSIPGLRLSFGRFLFANPAQGIASKDQGEGFRLGFRNRFGVSHIIRRESLDGIPDTSNRDHKLLLFEVNNIAGRAWSAIRGINLLFSLGQDRAPATRHWYGTAGLDASFSVPNSPFGGTLAYYYSERRPRGDVTDPPIIRGSGHVALGTLAYTHFEKIATGRTQITRRPLASLRLELGAGRGDDLDTPDRDESYAGETSSFAPDIFFLSTFAGKIQDVGPRVVGLKNKLYAAVVYQEERFTPIEIVARLLQIPDSDIASRLMRTGVRLYQFNSRLTPEHDEQHAGFEMFGESQVETPAGVRSSLQVAFFRPGGAIKPYFEERTLWSFVAKVTVVLGN